jgi:1-acyl-sn-glycerol-3-phosphate acyltransferase
VSALSRVPQLWDNDDRAVWRVMRYVVPAVTLGLAPSYGYGADRVPAEGGALLAANHFSGLDHPLLCCFTARPIYFMAKAELFDVPVFGELLHWTGTFPVRRGEGDRDALREARRIAKGGGIVGMHVEGTRQKFGHPGPIHLGALSIAITSQVPVIPVALDTFGWTLRNRKPCSVVYGEPISLDGLRGRAGADEAGRIVGDEIVRLWRLAVGATRAGFPEELPDGTKRSDVAAPGWRLTRDPAAGHVRNG